MVTNQGIHNNFYRTTYTNLINGSHQLKFKDTELPSMFNFIFAFNNQI